jgi:hypothetical protein
MSDNDLVKPKKPSRIPMGGDNHWINLQDINSFDWPGYDLKPIAPGKTYIFGKMSKLTFTRLVSALKECAGRETISRD